MTLPAVKINFLQNSLGNNAGLNTTPLFIGGAPFGTVGTRYSFGDANDVKATFGQGILADGVARYLELAGGTVDVILAARSVAATTGAVTSTSGMPTVTVAGTPRVTGDFIVAIVEDGDETTARFQWSADGGKTFSPAMTAGSTISLIDTGLTVTFGAGSYEAPQVARFSTHEATLNGTDLADALDVYLAEAKQPYFVAVLNDPVASSMGATLAATLLQGILSARAVDVYAPGIIQAGGAKEDHAVRVASFASFSSDRVTVIEGYAPIALSQAAIGRSFPVQPGVIDFAAAVGQSDLSSGVSAVSFGARPGVGAPEYDERTKGERGNASRFVEFRTWPGKNGTYFTNTWVRSDTTSDVTWFEEAMILDRIAQIVVQRASTYIGSSVNLANGPGGRIDPGTAARIDSDINGALAAELINGIVDRFGGAGSVDEVEYRTNQQNNIQLTKTLRGDVRVVVKAKVLSVLINIGLARTA